MKLKVFSIVIAVLLLSSYALAVSPGINTRQSGNTVTFSTVARIVTFNSVTNYIKMWNNSKVRDCYVDLRCVDAAGHRGYASIDSAVIRLPALGQTTPNTVVEVNFGSSNLGFVATSVGGATGNNDTVTYFVLGDQNGL